MRILIVEDEPKVTRTLVKGLEADHFAVDVAENGEDGLQLSTEIDYDLVILDWNLPKLDGLTVLRKLRKSGSVARILFLSARKEISDRITALQAGADDFLVKPFSFDELNARVGALLRRPTELLDKISVDDLVLDRMRHSVSRAGKLIGLTQREYAVLEYLMRNAGRTVTRTIAACCAAPTYICTLSRLSGTWFSIFIFQCSFCPPCSGVCLHAYPTTCHPELSHD